MCLVEWLASKNAIHEPKVETVGWDPVVEDFGTSEKGLVMCPIGGLNSLEE